MAVENGNLDLAKIMIKAGAVPDASMNLLRSVAGYNFFDAKFDGLKPLSEVANFLKSQGAEPTETSAVAAFRADAAKNCAGRTPAP